jgi:hypothetical protein
LSPLNITAAFDALGRRTAISVENGLSFPEAMEQAKLKYEENAQFKRLIQRLRGRTKAAGRARTAQGAAPMTSIL